MAAPRSTLGQSTVPTHYPDGQPIPPTEQLMQLDQAITLTLQEIDANFARAHQTITNRILPAVKRYGVASAQTWQGAKFWKHFFEVSANVALNPNGQDMYDPSTRTYTDTDAGSYADPFSPTTFHSQSRSHAAGYDDEDSANDSLAGIGNESADGTGFFETLKHARASSPPRLSNASLAAAAARGDQSARHRGREDEQHSHANWAPVESPFERLKKEVENEFGTSADASISDASSVLEYHRQQRQLGQKRDERVLVEDDDDSIDRRELEAGLESLQIDPDDRAQAARTAGKGKGREQGAVGVDASSSALGAPPQLSRRAGEALQSRKSAQKASTPKLLNKVLTAEQRKTDRHGISNQVPYPRLETTPKGAARRNPFMSQALLESASARRWDGIADLRRTPLNPKMRKAASRASKAAGGVGSSAKGAPVAPASSSEWDSDEDDESLAWPEGMSPPVTMQFSVPQSKYLKTPAKEAARMVVDDLLRTVGGSSPVVRAQARNLGSAERSSCPGGAVGTPLRKGPAARVRDGGPNKRRDSLPTPPTLTRKIGGPPPQPRLSTTPSMPPRAGGLAPGPTAASGAPQSAAAMLLDEGEDSLGDGMAGEDSLDVPEDLGTKLSAVAQTPGAVDRLLDLDEEDSDDDDDGDSEDDDYDDILGPPASGGLAHGVPPGSSTSVRSGLASQNAEHSGWTSSTTASSTTSGRQQRSIEDDTLFGVRHPSSTAAPLNPFARPANSSTAGTSSSFAPSGAAGAGAGGTAGSFRPLGDLDELGTIHGGRLVEREEDDTAATYAAPSPTPVNVHGRNRA